MRLWSKFLLLLVPLIVAPLLVLGYIAYGQVRDQAERATLDQMTLLLQQTQRRLEAKRATAAASARLLASHALVRKYALTDDPQQRYAVLQDPLLAQLSRFQRAFPGYSRIRFINPDGSVAASWSRRTDLRALLANAKVEPRLMTELRRTVGESRALLVPGGSEAPLRLIAVSDLRLLQDVDPGSSARPMLRGYVTLTVGLGALLDQITGRRIGATGGLMVVDTSGHVLAGAGPATGRGDPGRALERLPEGVRKSLSALSREPRIIDWNGEPTYVQAHPLGRGVALLARMPEAEIRAADRDLGRSVLGITLIAVVGTPLLVLLALRRMVVSPLARLSRFADEIGRGRLDLAVPASSGDEVGSLARSFESMRERLAQMQQGLRHAACHDSLTGLPNRRLLEEHLLKALADAQDADTLVGLLFLDLDGFKLVNDQQGHPVGDALLQALTRRLSAELLNEDYVAAGSSGRAELISRIGGDEFIIVVNNLAHAGDAGAIARRILESVHEPLTINGAEFKLGASIGIAVCPDDAKTPGELIRRADIAMYHAKARGRSQAAFYSGALDVEARDRNWVERRLRDTLTTGGLRLHYQPQLDLARGRIVGFEVLARWHDEEAGWIPPSRFIPIAEAAGLIAPLTRFILREACAQAHRWQLAGLPPVVIAVNISGELVRRGDVVGMVGEALSESGIEPAQLELEITESTLIEVDRFASRQFAELNRMGVTLALDDFGTGYSSLSYLRRFPFHRLKLDRSFVTEGRSPSGDPALVAAAVSMAHALGLAVVGEGAETERDVAFLRTAQCEIIQGYFVGRPCEAEHAGELLAKHRAGVAAESEHGASARVQRLPSSAAGGSDGSAPRRGRSQGR